MNKAQNLFLRAWKWWFTPRSSDPTVIYRERALRALLPVLLLLRPISILRSYSGTAELFAPSMPLWVSMGTSVLLILLSFYFLARQKIALAGAFFILSWYFADLLSLQTEGYWYPGYQISLIMQIILGTLLLPTRGILPFLVFQVSTVSIWGGWLDANYYAPPLLSTGEPVAVFNRAIITLAAQETIILFIVRYLRLEMEKSLRFQQGMIGSLEKRVSERTAELEVKNQELESFSYSISHDLRAPLRAVVSFSKILADDFSAELSPTASGFLQRIIASGLKMNVLIDELLDFSRLGSKPLELQTVSLNPIVKTVIETLAPETASRQIEWILADLPPAAADPVLIQQVFANLIGNAVKYSRNREVARIEVGSSLINGETVYHVRDNGAGFDMQYANKLFGVFQRLHREDEFEGTGIGLATVERILQRHGGRIWAEAKVNQGATFYFTLE